MGSERCVTDLDPGEERECEGGSSGTRTAASEAAPGEGHEAIPDLIRIGGRGRRGEWGESVRLGFRG